MNLARRARERLGLTLEELALLLDVPLGVLEDIEMGEAEPQGMVHALLVLLFTHPSQCAEVLIERRLSEASGRLPTHTALAFIARKIHNCQVA